MLWVPCVRFDLPADAAPRTIERAGRALEQLADALGSNAVAHLNLALSGAGQPALDARFPGLRSTLAALVDREGIELVTTPEHGALLPLLPVAELERQLQLNRNSLRTRFGIAGTRALWPTELAVSPRVLRAANRLGFDAILVDGSAPPHPGSRPEPPIGVLADAPGLFLLAVGRAVSSLFAAGRGPAQEELRRRPADHVLTPLVLALDWRPDSPELVGLDELLRRERTARIGDLLGLFPKAPMAAMPAGSATSAEGSFRPLAGEYGAGPARERTRLATRLAAQWRALDAAGLAALPRVREARARLDRAWRASRWAQAAAVDDLLLLERLLSPPRSFDAWPDDARML